MNTMNRCYPLRFKPGTSLSIGHWQTDVVNGATQMLRYNVVKIFEPVSLLADRRRKEQLERRSRPRTR
jgi:hypothetical protein